MPPPRDAVTQTWRFVRGLRRFLGDQLDVSAVRASVEAEQRARGDRFLTTLDALVWSRPTSVWQRLFDHAGAERADVVRLVEDLGLDGALRSLLDLGVYLSTEEATGSEPVRRGSTTFAVAPHDLFNPLVAPDFIAGTSGTRSAGTPVAASFAALRRMAVDLQLSAEMWDLDGAPSALWRPALPGSGGIIALLSSSIAGTPPERWFSQLDPQDRGVATSKRLANRLIGVAGWPVRLPHPVHVPTDDPEPVLAWCRDALRRSGRASLNVYPSSALALARRAIEQTTPLEGLVLRVVGEPVTADKAQAIRACGAEVMNAYAFTQQGAVATACPACADEELHLFEHEVAVVPRARRRADGSPVDAFAWTSLDRDARSMWINVENDDYGIVDRDAVSCSCLLGAMGMRTRLRSVRGMSKAVSGGVTLPAPVIEELVDRSLPGRFGGGPGDWQLAEGEERGASHLEVRADPRLGPLEERDVVEAVLTTLRRSEIGVLAASVWSAPGYVRLIRRAPAAAPSGKVLPFEALPSRAGEGR